MKRSLFFLLKNWILHLTNDTSVWDIDTYILSSACVLFCLLDLQFDNRQEFEEEPGQNETIRSFYERILISINIVFTVLFTIECILKLLALGVKV